MLENLHRGAAEVWFTQEEVFACTNYIYFDRVLRNLYLPNAAWRLLPDSSSSFSFCASQNRPSDVCPALDYADLNWWFSSSAQNIKRQLLRQ